MERSVSVLCVMGGVAAALACGGGSTQPPEPVPVPVPVPAPINPLIFGQEYYFDRDNFHGHPEWDIDFSYQFKPGGQCRHWDIEDNYRCTWDASGEGDRWFLTVTYFEGRGPDGRPAPPRDYGDRLEILNKGERLVDKEGRVYLLKPREGKTGKGKRGE